VMQWSVEDECKYQCMHEIEEIRRLRVDHAGQYQPEQYFGKWPFKRVLGMQEPLSVLFSLLNLVPHAMHLLIPSKRNKFAPLFDPLRSMLLAAAGIGCLAWTASAVFHCRDNFVTEKLDYHGAL